MGNTPSSKRRAATRAARDRQLKTGEKYNPARRATTDTDSHVRDGDAVPDADRSTLTAAVLLLLNDSFDAFAAGDRERADRHLGEAVALDAFCVSAVRGGITIGQIPNPEHDPNGWQDYLDAALAAAEDVQQLLAWARTQSMPSLLKDPIDSALDQLTRDDYGPVQILDPLGMPVWQFERARRRGIIPDPDLAGGRWSARAVAAVVAQLDEVKSAVGSVPDIGAYRAADLLADRFGIAVEAYVLPELDRAGLIPRVGVYKGADLFDGQAIERFDDRAALDRAVADGRLHTRDRVAEYMQLRRADVDHLVRSGRLAPVQWGRTPFQRRRSTGMVPLFRVGDLDALLAATDIDWDAVRAVPAGRPSLLAVLPSTDEPQKTD